MKKNLIVLMILIMIFSLTACNNSKTKTMSGESDNKAQTENIKEEPKKDLPENNYEQVGNGDFQLSGSFGSTEDGDVPLIYTKKDIFPAANIGINLQNMDGSLLTYIYYDGHMKDKIQSSDGYQGSIDLNENWEITEGNHKVEAVQYENNDSTKSMNFYRCFEVVLQNMQ